MYLAVDIGGTKTLVALFSRRGRVIRRIKFKTALTADDFLRDLVDMLKKFIHYDIVAVVVAIPGRVQKNYSVSFGNRDWPGIDIYSPIRKLFSCPIFFENDASLAAFYEGSFYKGRTVFLTFSTGIGGGIVENGAILPSSAEFEPGHKLYSYDGMELEWEDIAAASALEKAYHVDLATDLRGKAIMQDVAKRVSLGLSDIINRYNPQTIVLGGPLGKIYGRYVKYLPKYQVKFARPRRSLESVIYGCYLFARDKNKG